MVEFALVLPLLMLLVVGAVYLSLVLVLRQDGTWEAQQAVQAASRYSDAAQRCEAASGVLWALRGESPTPTATCTEETGLLISDDGAVLRVTVLGRLLAPPLVDWFLPHCSDGEVCVASHAGLMLP